jgi:integrase
MKLEKNANGWTGRFRCGGTTRARITIVAPDEVTAYARATRLRARIDALVEAGLPQEAARMATLAAEQKSERAFAEAERAMRDAARAAATAAPWTQNGLRTFGEVFDFWISGELRRKWPQVCQEMGEERVNGARLMFGRHIGGLLGTRSVADITLEDAEQLMPLIAHLAPATRRKYQTIVKLVMEFSVYPLRLRASSPIPRKFVEGAGRRPGFSFLYAEEEARVMRNVNIEVDERVGLGFTARNGTRLGESQRAVWGDADLKMGTFTLPKTKTEDARMWRLDLDVVEALACYRELCRDRGMPVEDSDPMLPGLVSSYDARRFRSRLLDSGVDRAALHAPTGDLKRIRIHDLRATFVTQALATGRGDRWVRDRTGHSADVLDIYRRPARTAAELDLGWFAPLTLALDPGHEAGQREENPQGKAGKQRPTSSSPGLSQALPGVRNCGDRVPERPGVAQGIPEGPGGLGAPGQLGPVTDEVGRCILIEAMQRATAEGRADVAQTLRLLLDGQLQHVASATRA